MALTSCRIRQMAQVRSSDRIGQRDGERKLSVSKGDIKQMSKFKFDSKGKTREADMG